MDYFPCSCPVCTSHEPSDVRACADDERETLLARHNLHVTYAELRRVKQAIREGTLLDLVDERARSHPTMLDGYRAMLEYVDQLEETDPVRKDSFFHTSAESARRPEVLRHHERRDRLPVDGEEILLSEGAKNRGFDATWRLKPPFGPFPRHLSKTYPLTAQVPDRLSREAYEAAADGIARLVDANPGTAFTVAHFDWPESALARLPELPLVDLTEEDAN